MTARQQQLGANEDVCKTAKGNGPKVGLAYDVGGRGDQSFNDSAYAGLEKAVKELDATCIEAEATGRRATTSAREERLRSSPTTGYNPVIAVGFVYSPRSRQGRRRSTRRSTSRSSTATTTDKTPNKNVADLVFAANEAPTSSAWPRR